jgi:hypothetical protein
VVGYGEVTPGDRDNTVRHSFVVDVVDFRGSTFYTTNNEGGGPTTGDGGGPVLTSGDERVAGIITALDTVQNWTVHERVSTYHESFIAPFLAGLPDEEDTDGGCRVSPGGATFWPAILLIVAARFSRRWRVTVQSGRWKK